jgi:hypothetical protein
VTIGGLLGQAKAVLCKLHAIKADEQAFISKNGYPKGKISKDARGHGYNQARLPGAGIIG